LQAGRGFKLLWSLLLTFSGHEDSTCDNNRWSRHFTAAAAAAAAELKGKN